MTIRLPPAVRALLLLCVLPLGVLPLGAATPPPAAPAAPPATLTLLPMRDTVVAYHLAPSRGEAIDVLVTYRAGGRALRMDLPDHTYMIATPSTRSLVLVVPLERTAADLSWSEGPQPLFLPDPHMGFTRKGEATVAGQRCTQWEALKEPSRNAICVTPDGVMLRNQFLDGQGRRSVVEALGVKQVAAAEVDFVVPLDFERLRAAPPDQAR